MIRSRFAAFASAAAFAAMMAGAAQAQTTVKLIPQADLKSLDPVWNTAAIRLNHVFMVFDTLSGPDTKMPTQRDGPNWFGWPSDEELGEAAEAYIPQVKPEERKAAIETIQKRHYEVTPFATTGQFQSPVANRKNIVSMPKTLIVTHWNTEKK